MGLGATPIGVFTALCPTLFMFFSTWETYHTHTLFLGYFNGPTEGLLMAISVMLLSGYYGPELWRQPLSQFFGLESILGNLTTIDIWVPLLLATFFIGHIPDCIRNVTISRQQKGLPVIKLFWEWTPMAIFVGSIVLWLGSPDSHLLKDNHVLLLCVTLSFVFGRMTTKIILAHLTRQPFPYWTVMLGPLIGGAVLVNIRWLGLQPVSARTEHIYLWATYLFSAVVYYRWALLVINAICDYLGINCLTIPTEKWQAAVAKAKAQ